MNVLVVRKARISKVFTLTVRTFKKPCKALHWLNTPCYALGEQIPMRLLDKTDGYKLVITTLKRMEHGVFA